MDQRLDMDDPKQQRIVNLITQFIASLTLSGNNPFAAFLPKFMMRWPIFDYLCGYKLQKETNDAMVEMFSPYIEEHEMTLDPNQAR